MPPSEPVPWLSILRQVHRMIPFPYRSISQIPLFDCDTHKHCTKVTPDSMPSVGSEKGATFGVLQLPYTNTSSAGSRPNRTCRTRFAGIAIAETIVCSTLFCFFLTALTALRFRRIIHISRRGEGRCDPDHPTQRSEMVHVCNR